jgi:hypothetical protein
LVSRNPRGINIQVRRYIAFSPSIRHRTIRRRRCFLHKTNKNLKNNSFKHTCNQSSSFNILNSTMISFMLIMIIATCTKATARTGAASMYESSAIMSHSSKHRKMSNGLKLYYLLTNYQDQQFIVKTNLRGRFCKGMCWTKVAEMCANTLP